MNYCKECGHKIEEGVAFCKECGTPVNGTQAEPVNPTPTPVQQPVQPAAPKQPMSKKTKTLLIAGIVAIVVLFGVHKMIESLMSKDRLIENFEQALHNEDAKAVANLLSSNDKKLEIDEESVKGLMDFYKENPEQIAETTSILKAQSDMYEQKAQGSPSFEEFGMFGDFAEEYLTDSGMINLVQDGKFLFYDKYELLIPAVYVELETNYKDTVLSIDGKEVATADEPNYLTTVGPYVPGLHTLTATLSTDFVDLNKEEKIYLNGYDAKEMESIYLEADEVAFELPYEEGIDGSAKLFINGKDVGVDLTENYIFGPVLTDGSMTYQVEVELPWGKVKTEELPIEDDYVDISYMNEELNNSLMDTVHQYEQEWSVAYSSGDVSKFTTATEPLKEVILESVNNNKEYRRAGKVQYLSSVFDIDSTKVYHDGENWVANVYGENLWNTAYYLTGDEALEMEETSNYQMSELIYDPKAKKWLVNYQDSLWGSVSDENPKEYTVKEPAVHSFAWGENAETAETEEGAES